MRILLAIDGSKDAETATVFLEQLPLPPSTALRIMVVVTVPTFALDVPPVREFKRSALEDAQHVVDDARASLASRSFGIETDVAVGDPKEEIVRAAEEWGADLVVLGARGLGKIKRFVLGSVSLAVARHARCPVLAVYWNSGEFFGARRPSRAYAYAVRPAVRPATRNESHSALPACAAAGPMSA